MFFAPDEEYETFEDWLESMKFMEWGDEFTIKAASELYKKPILVYDKLQQSCAYHIPEGIPKPNGILSECPDTLIPGTIVLIYNGENHYDSTKRKDVKLTFLKVNEKDISRMKKLTAEKEEERLDSSSSDEYSE